MNYHSPFSKLMLWTIGIFLVSFTVSYAEESTLNKVRTQYIEHILSSPKAGSIESNQKNLGNDGSWPDINYAGKNRSRWEPARHVDRLLVMTNAYANPEHPLSGDKTLLADITRGLEYYLEKNLKCPNWWFNQIGVPRKVADLLVLIGDDLPKNVAASAIEKILSQAKIGMTGQNKVWLAEIVLVRSLFEKNEKALKEARDVILSEIRVTTGEGIQPDWSFHQHGPQQQFGNYGGAFAASTLKWATILSGTELALTDKEVDIMRNYILHGTCFVTWRGRLDLSACGRQVYKDCQIKKGRGVINQLKSLATIDPKNKKLYEYLLTGNTDTGINTLVGNKHFWRSDMMVHRRPTWYASVKMSSKRVIGSETCNSENMLGRNLGNGALYIYQNGDELKNIQPVWDWHRIPGTTTDQSLNNLYPRDEAVRPPVSFVGGVTDFMTGTAVFDFKQGGLVAKKAWFFQGDRVICLGAGITSTSDGLILTSIQQSLVDGNVITKAGVMEEGSHLLKPGDWVHHAGIGYHLIAGNEPVLKFGPQTGNWRRIYTTQGDTEELSLDVFSLWFDHGMKPENQSYAYEILPNSSPSTMDSLGTRSPLSILSNTPELQAISLSNVTQVQAVFYQPGTLEYAEGKSVVADTPCLVNINMDRKKIVVADPTQTKKKLTITLDGKAITFDLPQGGTAGQSVIKDF